MKKIILITLLILSLFFVENVFAETSNYCCTIKNGDNLKYKTFVLEDGGSHMTKCMEGEPGGELFEFWPVSSPSECKADTGVCCKTSSSFAGKKTTKYEFEPSKEICEKSSGFEETVSLSESECDAKPDEVVDLPKEYGCCKIEETDDGVKTTAFVPTPDQEQCNALCGPKGADKCTFLSDLDKFECTKKKASQEKATSDGSQENPLAGLERIDDYKQITGGVPTLIGNIIKTAMGLMGSVGLAMFVYGGLLWMTAAGNAEHQKKAINILLWSSMGIIVILASYVIVEFVFKAFGL